MNIGKIDQAFPKTESKKAPITANWKHYKYAPDLIDHLETQGINVQTLPSKLSKKWKEKTGGGTQPFFLPKGIDLNQVENNPDAETFLRPLGPNARPRDYIKSMRLAKKYMNKSTGGTVYIPEKMLVEDTNSEWLDHYGYGREIRGKIANVLTETNIAREALNKPVKSLAKFTAKGQKGFRDPKKEEEYLKSIGISPYGDVLGNEQETEEQLWGRIGKGEEFDEMRRINIEELGGG